jgi:hypothetical protein
LLSKQFARNIPGILRQKSAGLLRFLSRGDGLLQDAVRAWSRSLRDGPNVAASRIEAKIQRGAKFGVLSRWRNFIPLKLMGGPQFKI